MGDETPNTMNLDLNLDPFPSTDDELGSETLGEGGPRAVNLEEWIEGQRVRYREAVRRGTRYRWRSVRPGPIPPEPRSIALDLMVNSSTAADGGLQTGEGSVPSQQRNNEETKTCENNAVLVANEELKEGDAEKLDGDGGSFFDCNICLDMARDPIVTCCGHLFCWSCIYRWLQVHSDAKECPVCKGEVTIKNVTPIYGRGNSTPEPEEDSSVKIPARPQARRIESWRQTIQRNAFAIPMEEMIRRLGSRFDLSRDLVQVQPQNGDGADGSPERANSLLNQLLTSRGMRREHNAGALPDDPVEVELTQGGPTNLDMAENRRVSSLLRRRSHAHRAATISNLTSALSSRDRLLDTFFRHHHHVEREQEQPPPVDDRDSMSSIAAVIHSESQTFDTAVEIDSTVALSTSSSRRRNDASRVSDVDSGDSRAHRRRRFH
ncbi:uncharacterized protein LOC127789253 [Diospyros lotus]|uniref:uncharacterized protein LOC127789253 n=1 Tax=Diospyros lotus TaxID=55363 RepID=UPI00225B9851|nr:uncharacterized protein LOC127789253 [Diospyros lotus]XP_052174069.1 uncharacterized protein LOC127789253 [Diospyros lotus]XP_052174070.1 uncharacterized protein LOC127789253 [Diospyros lotus]